MISIFAVPRVDRGLIWGRAEEYSRLHPEQSFATVLAHAAQDYDDGLMGTTPLDDKLLDAIIDRPESLMKRG